MPADRVDFIMELMPPSVNHYIDHGRGHGKTPQAQAFCDEFALLSKKLKNKFVVSKSKRFRAELHYWPGPKGRGDVDNYNKLPLDCCARAGMLRDKDGRELSDAWIKKLAIEIHDAGAERKIGPEMRVILEAL